MALEKSRQTINQLEHQLSLGDSAYASATRSSKIPFLHVCVQLLTFFYQLLHQQLLAFSAKNMASSSNEAASAPSHSPVKQQAQQSFRSFDGRASTDSLTSSSNAPHEAASTPALRSSSSGSSATMSQKVITHGSNGAVEQVKDDGSRVISYRNGSSKE